MAARPTPPTGTITLNTPNPTYQETVTFDWSVSGKYKSYYYPLIYVAAYQDGVLVYGQLDLPDTAFLLGGGSSPWKSSGGGPADGQATLYLYPGLHDGPIIELAKTPIFHIDG